MPGMMPCNGPSLVGRRPLIERGDKRELGVLNMGDFMSEFSKSLDVGKPTVLGYHSFA